MESHHVKTLVSGGTSITATTSRLRHLGSEVISLIEALRYGKLQLTHEEYRSLETASQDFSKIAASMTEEVKALGKRRKDAVVAQGQKMLSHAEYVKSEVMTTHGLKNRVTFIRNIQLFFNPPEESRLDSAPVQKRKKLTRERCERIRTLTPNRTILWAVAFAPSAWDSNVLPKSTFDFVIEFLDPRDLLGWPPNIYEVLTTLGAEQPLRDSSHFGKFLALLNQCPERNQYTMKTIAQRAEAQQPHVTGVDEAAQAVIEMAFLVPRSKVEKILELHPSSAVRHSIILTIPTEDRVSTVVISIPRGDAIRFAYEHTLPVIFNSSSSL